MEIVIESLLDGARRARGAVVIIDVYRAFTTAAVALDRGATEIVIVADPAEALRLRDAGVGHVCAGEVGGKRPDGFDFGNSPHEMASVDLAGRTVILSTRAGTVGVEAATGADTLWAGSLVVAEATVRHLRALAPPLVTLVAMGWGGRARTDEDEQCALYLRNRLNGRSPNQSAVTQLVLAAQESAKFDDPARPWFHPDDRRRAVTLDTHDFAMPITRERGLLVARAAR